MAQQQGTEVGPHLPHVNWFGSNVTLPDYTGVTPTSYQSFLASTVIPQIHAAGGLASYNHPYGSANGAALPQFSRTRC